MKMAPGAKFFDALSGILDHSWEGVPYGAKSRLEFMRRAMKNDPAVYVPYGYKSVAPGEYEVSAGSLPSLPWRKVTENSVGENQVFFSVNEPLTQANVNALINQGGLQLGDQITFIGFYNINGKYEIEKGYVIVGVDEVWQEVTNDFENAAMTKVGTEGMYFEDANEKAAAAVVIVSRGQEAATAKRSNEKMLLIGEYRNLLSLEAMNAAIASYQTQTAYNSLNSDWYLNQGSSQPYNGRIVAGDIAVTPTGGQSAVVTAAIAQQVVNGKIQQKLFTVDGSENGALIGSDGQPVKVGAVTITYAMVNDKTELAGTEKWSADYLEQAGF